MVSESENLKLLHEHQLNLLKYLLEMADDHQIPYLLIGGTLLGAVRHQGFIPWDDDVDIGFTRPDFAKLLVILENKSKNNQIYGILKPNDLNYPFDFGRLYDKQLEFRGPAGQENVFIDLIPLDEYPKNFRSYWLFNRLIIIKDHFFVATDFSKRIINLPIKILAKMIPRKGLIQRREKLHRNTNDDGYLYNWSSPYLLNEKYDKKTLNSFVSAEFESLAVKIPGDYQQILTRQYGDWQKIPEKENQRTHFPLESIKIVKNDQEI